MQGVQLCALGHFHEQLKDSRILAKQSVTSHDAVYHLKADACHEVILKVLANRRAVKLAWDPKFLQQRHFAYARQLQQLRCLERTGSENHLALSSDIVLGAILCLEDNSTSSQSTITGRVVK